MQRHRRYGAVGPEVCALLDTSRAIWCRDLSKESPTCHLSTPQPKRQNLRLHTAPEALEGRTCIRREFFPLGCVISDGPNCEPVDTCQRKCRGGDAAPTSRRRMRYFVGSCPSGPNILTALSVNQVLRRYLSCLRLKLDTARIDRRTYVYAKQA
jgi:hypothetical protein